MLFPYGLHRMDCNNPLNKMTSVANETTLWPEHLNEQLTPFEALACSSNSQVPHKYVPFGHKEKLENQA